MLISKSKATLVQIVRMLLSGASILKCAVPESPPFGILFQGFYSFFFKVKLSSLPHQLPLIQPQHNRCPNYKYPIHKKCQSHKNKCNNRIYYNFYVNFLRGGFHFILFFGTGIFQNLTF